MFDSPMMGAFATMSFAILVIAIIFFVLKKYSSKFNLAKDNNLKVVGKSSLSPKNHLYIIEVEGKKLLVGATDSNINLISELDKEEEKSNEEIIKKSINQSEDISFKSFLKTALNKS
jgi:flagellar protein FliO/FliZ